MGGILSTAPLDLVDLLFDLEGLEVVEFRLVGLEFCVKLVLAGFFLCCWSMLVREGCTGDSKLRCTHGLVTLK